MLGVHGARCVVQISSSSSAAAGLSTQGPTSDGCAIATDMEVVLGRPGHVPLVIGARHIVSGEARSRPPCSGRNGGYASVMSETYACTRMDHRLMLITTLQTTIPRSRLENRLGGGWGRLVGGGVIDTTSPFVAGGARAGRSREGGPWPGCELRLTRVIATAGSLDGSTELPKGRRANDRRFRP